MASSCEDLHFRRIVSLIGVLSVWPNTGILVVSLLTGCVVPLVGLAAGCLVDSEFDIKAKENHRRRHELLTSEATRLS